MAQAARNMTYQQTRPARRPDIEVVPGRGRDAASSVGVSPLFMTIFKVVIAAFLFIALVGVARVWFTSSTVSVLMSSEQLESRIGDLRSHGADLEVQQTVLSNPNRIESYAADTLKMVQVSPADFIDLSSGAVATDSNGRLSLSGTLEALRTTTTATAAVTSTSVSTVDQTTDESADQTTTVDATDQASDAAEEQSVTDGQPVADEASADGYEVAQDGMTADGQAEAAQGDAGLAGDQATAVE